MPCAVRSARVAPARTPRRLGADLYLYVGSGSERAIVLDVHDGAEAPKCPVTHNAHPFVALPHSFWEA